MHGSPAFAKCAAIREPIVPAPSTNAFSMRRFMARLFSGFTRAAQFAGTGYKTSMRRSNGRLIREYGTKMDLWRKKAKSSAL
jgi:hypothetical protein